MIVYAAETYKSVIGEIIPLLERHYEEIALHKEFPLMPDFDKYEHLHDGSKLAIVTAREDLKLIGYAVFFVVVNAHYQTMTVAANDIIFIDKPYRTGMTGIRLIAESEKHLRMLGVNRITWHVKPTLDWGKILERKGYAAEEVVWAKMLKGEDHGS
jgi:GNAT superfamily N-acetyltransferase